MPDTWGGGGGIFLTENKYECTAIEICEHLNSLALWTDVKKTNCLHGKERVGLK